MGVVYLRGIHSLVSGFGLAAMSFRGTSVLDRGGPIAGFTWLVDEYSIVEFKNLKWHIQLNPRKRTNLDYKCRRLKDREKVDEIESNHGYETSKRRV